MPQPLEPVAQSRAWVCDGVSQNLSGIGGSDSAVVRNGAVNPTVTSKLAAGSWGIELADPPPACSTVMYSTGPEGSSDTYAC